MMSRRAPVLVLIATLCVASLSVVDGTDVSGRSSSASIEADASQLGPLVSDASARSSTWFCAGGTGTVGGGADHTVVVTNPTDRPVSGRIEVYTYGTGVKTAQPAGNYAFKVAPGGRFSARLGDIVAAEWVAALVDVAGGGVVVDQELRGPAGADVARCASRASTEWYFPWGQSPVGSSLRLALFNPFPGDAVVDLTFVTDDGFRSPEDFESLLVPARQLLIVDVGAVVTRRAHVSSIVRVRTGRVVAEQLQTTTSPSGGVSLAGTLGAQALASTWYFANGRADRNTVERFVVFNPGELALEAELRVLNEAGDDAARIEPFALRVGPNGYAEIILNREPRLSLPNSHAVVVQAFGDVPMAVARILQTGDQAPQQAQPETKPGDGGNDAYALPAGLAVTTGSAVVAQRWLASSVVPQGGGAARVAVFNPSPDKAVTASFFGMGLAAIPDVVVPAGQRKEISVMAIPGNSGLPGGAIQVTATGPVVVEHWVATVGPSDIAAELAVPTAESATQADPFR